MGFKKVVVTLGLMLVFSIASLSVQAQDAQPASAVDAILAAFDQHPLVAIGETHGVKELGDFYQTLVRAPGFADKVDAIVVEFGNAFYQSVIDRYVAGEAVTFDELSPVWRDVAGAGFGALDAPMYEQFFTAVREVNQTLPAENRLRVLLGDPAVDWSTATAADIQAAVQTRDSFFANIVDTEVMQKGLKALIITGASHLSRGASPVAVSFDGGGSMQGAAPTEMPRTLLQILDEKYPGKTYVVQVHTGFIDAQCNTDAEAKLASWTIPALATVKGTWLESTQCIVYPMNAFMRLGDGNGPSQMPGAVMGQAPGGQADGPMGQPPPDGASLVMSGNAPDGQPLSPGQAPFPTITADAYLYLGTRDSLTLSVPDPAIYTDAYLQELDRRSQILRGQPVDRARLTNPPTRLIDAYPLS